MLSRESAADDQPTAAPTGDAGRFSRARAYGLLWIIAVTVFVADQSSKLWIVARVPFDPFHSHGPGNDIEVIRSFFYIIHVGNTGAAWSMFSGRSVTLALLAAGTLIAIYFWRHTLGLKHERTWATGNKLRDMQAPPKKVAGEGHAAAATGGDA